MFLKATIISFEFVSSVPEIVTTPVIVITLLNAASFMLQDGADAFIKLVANNNRMKLNSFFMCIIFILILKLALLVYIKTVPIKIITGLFSLKLLFQYATVECARISIYFYSIPTGS